MLVEDGGNSHASVRCGRDLVNARNELVNVLGGCVALFGPSRAVVMVMEEKLEIEYFTPGSRKGQTGKGSAQRNVMHME
ncbi:ATP/GTP-binding protein [Anopheles sinensis]|uniref:ATP/GTP-binding protein n=1 Tax=Anopheles sinensis TaxID=74873 RepID=A0A084WAW6_ANOSI|nr:ATP/GTP-binding protein [Anopheles sinensis]